MAEFNYDENNTPSIKDSVLFVYGELSEDQMSAIAKFCETDDTHQDIIEGIRKLSIDLKLTTSQQCLDQINQVAQRGVEKLENYIDSLDL